MQWKESTNEYIFVTMLCFCLKIVFLIHDLACT